MINSVTGFISENYKAYAQPIVSTVTESLVGTRVYSYLPTAETCTQLTAGGLGLYFLKQAFTTPVARVQLQQFDEAGQQALNECVVGFAKDKIANFLNSLQKVVTPQETGEKPGAGADVAETENNEGAAPPAEASKNYTVEDLKAEAATFTPTGWTQPDLKLTDLGEAVRPQPRSTLAKIGYLAASAICFGTAITSFNRDVNSIQA